MMRSDDISKPGRPFRVEEEVAQSEDGVGLGEDVSVGEGGAGLGQPHGLRVLGDLHEGDGGEAGAEGGGAGPGGRHRGPVEAEAELWGQIRPLPEDGRPGEPGDEAVGEDGVEVGEAGAVIGEEGPVDARRRLELRLPPAAPVGEGEDKVGLGSLGPLPRQPQDARLKGDDD